MANVLEWYSSSQLIHSDSLKARKPVNKIMISDPALFVLFKQFGHDIVSKHNHQ